MLKFAMDPCFFSIKDPSLANVAKLSREFEDEFEGPFMDKKISKRLIRQGVVNVTIDTKNQKEAFLMVNFGVETECTDMMPYNGAKGQDLLDLLSNAQRELMTYEPPVPTLECSYREFKKVGRLSVTKVYIFNMLFILKSILMIFTKGSLLSQSSLCLAPLSKLNIGKSPEVLFDESSL